MAVQLRGLAAASERLPPAEIAARISRFYSAATRAIVARDGTVDKLMNDQVTAFFGVPYNDLEHDRRAVEAASAVIATVEDFWGGALASGAVGTGQAFVGNVGEGDTRDYTAIGQLVNIVSRLPEHAGPGELLLLPQTYGGVAEWFPEAALKMIAVAGVSAPLRVRVAVVRDRPPETARGAARTGSETRLLTPRERQVAALVAQGLTNRQIADEMGLSERTAESHLERIRSKLGVHNRAQIAAWATERLKDSDAVPRSR